MTDVCWFKDVLFIVGNNSKLYQYNTTSHKKHVVEYANSVTSAAVDWITGKIYWADQKKRIVSFLYHPSAASVPNDIFPADSPI